MAVGEVVEAVVVMEAWAYMVVVMEVVVEAMLLLDMEVVDAEFTEPCLYHHAISTENIDYEIK